jgi:hypothetical protein
MRCACFALLSGSSIPCRRDTSAIIDLERTEATEDSNAEIPDEKPLRKTGKRPVPHYPASRPEKNHTHAFGQIDQVNGCLRFPESRPRVCVPNGR